MLVGPVVTGELPVCFPRAEHLSPTKKYLASYYHLKDSSSTVNARQDSPASPLDTFER